MTNDELLSYVAIERVQRSYADIVTRRAWDELSSIMVPDCPITVDTVAQSYEFVGPEQIGNFISSQIERFDFFEFVILNTVIETDVARGVAAGRMYMQEIRHDRDGGVRTDAYGVYHDRFERDAGGAWKMARRFYRSFARTNLELEGGEMTTFPPPSMDLHELMA